MFLFTPVWKHFIYYFQIIVTNFRIDELEIHAITLENQGSFYQQFELNKAFDIQLEEVIIYITFYSTCHIVFLKIEGNKGKE